MTNSNNNFLKKIKKTSKEKYIDNKHQNTNPSNPNGSSSQFHQRDISFLSPSNNLIRQGGEHLNENKANFDKVSHQNITNGHLINNKDKQGK